MPQKPHEISLDDLVSKHPSMERLAKAAFKDLKTLNATKDTKIRSQKRTISANRDRMEKLAKEYQSLADHIFNPDTVTLVDRDEKTHVRVPVSKACQFSPFLKNAFTGSMQEAQKKCYKTNFDESTLRVLAKAIVCDETLWETVGIFEGYNADDLVCTMEACDFLGARQLFEAALGKLQRNPVAMAVETAFTVMKLSTVSEWQQQWRSLESTAAKVISWGAALNGAGSLDPTLLKQLDSEQLAKVIQSVPTIENTFKDGEWDNTPIRILSADQLSAEAALLRADSHGADVTVQIPVRVDAIPIDHDLHLPMEHTFGACLTATFTDGEQTFKYDDATVLGETKGKTIKVKMEDESYELSLVNLLLCREPLPSIPTAAQYCTSESEMSPCCTSDSEDELPLHQLPHDHTLEEASELQLEWMAVPSKVHLQCFLLLRSRDATLAELAHVLGSTEESDRLAAQILLDYVANCFAQLCKSRALLNLPAGFVRKLVERLGADEAGSEPLVLRWLLAWVAQHGEEGSQLLDDLVDVDLGWNRALAKDGGLSPEEKSVILGSRRFNEVLAAALALHYTATPGASGSAGKRSAEGKEGPRSTSKRCRLSGSFDSDSSSSSDSDSD